MGRSSKHLFLLDRTPWWLLVGGFFAAMFGFAVVYWLLTTRSAFGGLISPQDEETAGFLESLYFSVITQATLGYGDFRPVGLSRGVAAIQVLVGLIGAGVVIAKITAAPTASMRRLQQKIAGNWWDYIVLPDGRELIGILRITRVSGGTSGIRYSGEDYDEDGRLRAFFNSELVDDDWPLLLFRYSTRDSNASYFGEGWVTLNFDDPAPEKPCVYYTASAKGYVKGFEVSFEAWRFTDADDIKSLQVPEFRNELARKLLRKARARSAAK